MEKGWLQEVSLPSQGVAGHRVKAKVRAQGGQERRGTQASLSGLSCRDSGCTENPHPEKLTLASCHSLLLLTGAEEGALSCEGDAGGHNSAIPESVKLTLLLLC